MSHELTITIGPSGVHTPITCTEPATALCRRATSTGECLVIDFYETYSVITAQTKQSLTTIPFELIGVEDREIIIEPHPAEALP